MAQASKLMAGEAVYVYCFSLPDIQAPNEPGVDESRPVFVHSTGGLSAVVSGVSLADFTGEQGESNLQDIAWLGPRACRHAVMVERVMASAPVFPLPFGTLFSSIPMLEQEMALRQNDIAKVLRQVAGCQEWSVESTLDRAKAVDYRLNEGLQTGRFRLPESVGRRHLEEQKLRRQLAEDLEVWVQGHLEQTKETLLPLSRAFCPRRAAEGKTSHWAFLVPDAQVGAFRQQADSLSTQCHALGLAFRVTGPWPPYTFCATQ